MWCALVVTESILELLLFLSALLTGFTGVISGERRADAPAVQQSVAQALEIVAETEARSPAPARHTVAAARSPIVSEPALRPCWALRTATSMLNARQVNEKRLV
jgi:hypothetical protein